MEHKKRLIYADSGQELVEYLKRHLIVGDSEFLSGFLKGVEALADGLVKLTPVDAVEVVRCLECAIPHNKYTGCPKLNGLVTTPDFFCPYGERRTDDNG